EEIEFAIEKLTQNLQDDFMDEVPVFIGVLNGSFRFTAQVMKNYNYDCKISFVKIASYQGTQNQSIEELIGINEDLKDKHVVILEDIVDTGNTVEFLKNKLKTYSPKSVKIATMFFKPEVYQKNIKIDYSAIRIQDKFIVGYGLDYNGLGRNLNDVYVLSENN
ncbi:MAG: hypoxanthine phosphoribosyltransferase, partial [Flavobacterium sp.]